MPACDSRIHTHTHIPNQEFSSRNAVGNAVETLLDAVSRLHGTSFSFSVLFIVSQDPLVPCQCRGVSVECPIEIPSIFFSLGFLTCQAVLVMYRFNSLHVYVILCLCIHHVELHCIPSQWNTPRTCKSVEPPNILLWNPVQFLTIKIAILSHPNLWPWACESNIGGYSKNWMVSHDTIDENRNLPVLFFGFMFTLSLKYLANKWNSLGINYHICSGIKTLTYKYQLRVDPSPSEPPKKKPS